MSEVIDSSFAGPRLQTVLLLVFATTALLLALVGIYGVTSYNVARRTREIGVRIAIGASVADVVGRVARLAILGILLGCTAAIVLSRALQSLVFEVDALDPHVFATVALLLLGTAILASAIPARRATAVDPASALRLDS